MRERLGALGVPVPRWAPTIDAAAFGWPVVVKAVRGGYDGRGVWFVDRDDPLPEVEFIVEERVPLRRELAVLVARSPFGQVAVYPVVETVQLGGICVEVLAPAPDLDPARAVEAQRLAIGLADELGVIGLLAVELFETGAGLLVNELAMRPHNSGHWTIEGARTSQFEQHLRAVLDSPLGDTGPTAPAVVMAAAAEALAEFEVPYEVGVVSAHRTPQKMLAYAESAADRGLQVIIAGAGGAAHLPGMVASATTLPVIGVPVPLKYLDGLDSLLSIVQMPAGVPVATVSVGGARNAGLLAVRILGIADLDLSGHMSAY